MCVKSQDVDEFVNAVHLISDEERSDEYIMPAALDPRVGPAVATAVSEAARI